MRSVTCDLSALCNNLARCLGVFPKWRNFPLTALSSFWLADWHLPLQSNSGYECPPESSLVCKENLNTWCPQLNVPRKGCRARATFTSATLLPSLAGEQLVWTTGPILASAYLLPSYHTFCLLSYGQPKYLEVKVWCVNWLESVNHRQFITLGLKPIPWICPSLDWRPILRS